MPEKKSWKKVDLSDNEQKDIKLSWNEIKKNYRGTWIELVNYEWDSNSNFPDYAVVRNASEDRTNLLDLINQQEDHPESVILFVDFCFTLYTNHHSNIFI